ncbi:PIG-L family deacetylase [Jannaschia sp. S6380]|uniref:PIG-L family deacetylase n=1 Tax=Jannaschia sp. S6380 TaxID=2926408 RepID=UPI001FF62F3B|nr:PIG-L family deacetylase [Jannaschia sp. S6380]MCK0168347.1 PIG-L family deacetylase [Jannaschia sp. S6380]
MTPDQARLEADRARPRIVELWHALTALRTPLTFLQSGAHPDDETSAMLAALRFRDGIGVGYACATRGEGGQNDIGRARGTALGTLRTAEMEAAAARLDMDLHWLGTGPEDPIRDFGFSKSGEETLAHWGRDRTRDRFAAILRRVRPDMLCPTFLDVPGQHGHHRAMTALAPEAMARAADPGVALDGLPPWTVQKLYLPAWSGAGQAYDDDLPPPPATVTVPGAGRDPVTGWTWARMGQHSRAMHRTQGMGRWPPEAGDFPLHRVGGPPEVDVSDGLPRSLADLDIAGGAAVQAMMDAARDAFPDPEAVARHAAAALARLRAAQPAPEDAHRVDRKIAELGRVLHLASGADIRAHVDADLIGPDAAVGFDLEASSGDARDLSVDVALPEGWRLDGNTLSAKALPDPYPTEWRPLSPPRPALEVGATVAGERIAIRLPFDRTPAPIPDRGVQAQPQTDVVNRAATRRDFTVQLTPPDAALDLPDGWARDGDRLTPPPSARGRRDIPILLDGRPARQITPVQAPHVTARVLARPAVLRLSVIDAALPEGRVGYVGAGHDRVAHWMRRMGLDVVEPSDAQLDDAGYLAALDSLVIGIFALRFRPGLSGRMPVLHAWTRAGGTLLTLYHRPWDNWDPAATPPKRLQIGRPSLRWRVTDAGATVTHLAPDHAVLSGPNRIGATDWEGWNKERGLYFAQSWDPAYVPLLAMSDPGEAPLEGALLSAEIGAGRHTHCALILHHQMEMLVPGAFRLMANLVAPRA